VNRLATDRLLVAAFATALGALVAVLAGLPEAAVLAAPWAVLLVLGVANSQRRRPSAAVAATTSRLVVGDELELITSVSAAAGSIEITHLPEEGFWLHGALGDRLRSSRVAEAVSQGTAELRCRIPAMRWGAHDVGRVRITLTEPYGLFRWDGIAENELVVRVHPKMRQLHELLAPWLVRRVAGAHRSRAVGQGVEYADIRPYSPGDSLRQINWRASARSNEMWVSQRHPDQATDVVLLLDSFVESGHDAHTAVGLAIEAAVALAENHLAVTDRVGLVEFGGVVRWVSPGTGSHQLQRLTDALLSTGLYANVARRPLSVIPPRALPPRSFVVALTPLLDERFITGLFLLAARGHDVAVIECVPTSAEGIKGTTEASQLVQRFWQAGRQVLRDRLAENGVATARWHADGHLSLTLEELSRRRHRTVRAGRR